MQKTVIGLDLSTTTAKAIAWNADGQALAEGRAPLSLERPEPNAYEQHPDAWWRAVQTALGGVTGDLATHARSPNDATARSPPSIGRGCRG